MNEREYWLGFSVFQGIGPATFRKLLDKFGSAKAAWEAPPKDLKVRRLGEKVLAEFARFRENFSPSVYAKVLVARKIAFITQNDKDYPERLLSIVKPPIVLFLKGDAKVLGVEPLIGIVGTRKTTQYGREVTEMVTNELVYAGFTVVSGLAMGVDAVAHKTTIEAGGKTVAVLGCGIDCCTPRENQNLYDQILKSGGVIVSELPMSHPPIQGSFPSRNRIIAGLSDAVLVTEGAEDSGALITADYALKFNRKVFAVPGPITSGMSKGPNNLINLGAKLVASGQDIIKELRIMNYESGIKTKANDRPKFKGTKEEQKILEFLEYESMQFDELVRKTKLDAGELGSILSLLEIRGIVRSSNGSFSLTTPV